MTSELALAAAVALSWEVSNRDFAPVTVHLVSKRPSEDSAYQEHFRCPIIYGADQDALEITVTRAELPNRLSYEGMSRFFETHLTNELSRLNDTTELERRVRDQIGDFLREGFPTLGAAAQSLGMSSRTLQRRWSADGIAYQDVLMDARRTLSEQLLRRTDYALAEIAFLTGFSDQCAFTRAFKRWHCQIPANYRRGGKVQINFRERLAR